MDYYSMPNIALRVQDSNQGQLSGVNLPNLQDTRSDAYLEVRERRVTLKVGQIHPPRQEAKKWLISSLLLLEVVPDYICIVAP